LSLDRISIGDASFCTPGGSALFGALASTLFGAKVALMAFVGYDYPANILDKIRGYGVDVRVVFLPDKPSTRFDLVYDRNMKLSHIHVRSPLFDCFLESEIPDLHTRLVNISTNPFPLQKKFIEKILAKNQADLPLISLQTHRMHLTDVNPHVFMDLLRCVDFFFASETDLEVLFSRFYDFSEIVHQLSSRSKMSRVCFCR
jgi:sugar/nucleoside kinase (ribokinase family)